MLALPGGLHRAQRAVLVMRLDGHCSGMPRLEGSPNVTAVAITRRRDRAMVARKALAGMFHRLAGALYSSIYIHFMRPFMCEQVLFSTRAIEFAGAKLAVSRGVTCRCL
jgi:hypothetical protein